MELFKTVATLHNAYSATKTVLHAKPQALIA